MINGDNYDNKKPGETGSVASFLPKPNTEVFNQPLSRLVPIKLPLSTMSGPLLHFDPKELKKGIYDLLYLFLDYLAVD